MNFQTLENISTEEILAVFNLSFSDYIVPFHLTKEQLESRMKSDSIRLDLSAGAFEDNQLSAFILHCYDVVDGCNVVYNAGTGVIPAKRGMRLTAKLYDHILPLLRRSRIDKIQLEVITTNAPAIKTYKNIGFGINRQLECLKGVVNISGGNSGFEVRNLDTYEWPLLQSFWDFKPSWQNSVTAVENVKTSNVSVGAYNDDELIGYAICNPVSRRIQQLAVSKTYRRRGAGRQLLQFISSNYGTELAVINIEKCSESTLQFFTGAGMKNYVSQYEMEMVLA